MRRLTGLKWFILMLLALSLLPVSAQSSSWTVTQAQLLSDFNGVSPVLQGIALSPDGETLAWGASHQLCLYPLQSSEPNCFDTPEIFSRFGKYSYLSWSPDGKTLVFTDNFFITLNDPDIWTFDVATSAFQDRTDDHIIKGILSPKPGEVPLIDYLPTWNPANGDLYFFRSIRSQDSTSIQLELLPLTRTDPKPVSDFSLDFPTLSVYRSAPISPDGTQMAIIVLGANLNDPKNGVWLYSLKDQALKQIMVLDDLKKGLPDWAAAKSQLYPMLVQWVGNDAWLVSAQDTQLQTSLGAASYYVDLAAKSVTPLVDFSDVPDEAALLRDSADPLAPLARMPRAGVVTPDGSAYLYEGNAFPPQKAYIWMQPLPPDGSEPMQIGVIDSFQTIPAADSPPAISADGKHALLFGYWLTLQPP